MMERFFSLDKYYRHLFGEKIYKISLNAGMNCPNRDGTIGRGGCIFCSEGGSGDFAGNPLLSITEQIESGKELVKLKSNSQKFVAYFQAFTNTYAPIEYLRKVFYEAMEHPDIVGISIATRPDCFSDSIFELIRELSSIKPIWIELGLQTIHKTSIDFIRRGYANECFEETVRKLQEYDIPVIAHVILGLPWETKENMLQTVQYVDALNIKGIKLQLLHILKNTDLYYHYVNHPFPILSMEEYIDITISCLEIVSPDVVIHRITGDGPKEILECPLWSTNKRMVLNSIHKELKKRNTYQGAKKNARSINSL
ncbi:MAG: TIGR01212 family radical SAM protein [Lachnospiraceae bacterium]|nr:TIGR01212 family radical SAM protein [Lachnospiraceae bacterium]